MVLCNFERTKDTCLTIIVIILVSVFAAKPNLMQVLVAVRQVLVLIESSTQSIATKETFVLQTIDLILRAHTDRNIETRRYHRRNERFAQRC